MDHHLEILHTALTKCTATPAPPTLCSGFCPKTEMMNLQSPTMYARALKTMLQWSSMHNAWACFWRPCRAKRSNILSSFSLPFPLSSLPSSLTYCISFLIWASLLQPRPLCLHLINYFFCALLGLPLNCSPRQEGREKGTVQFCGERQVVARKCPVKIRLAFYVCLVKQWNSMLWLCVCVYLSLCSCIQYQRREKRQTHKECL